MVLRRYGATMLLGLGIAGALGASIALVVLLMVGNPQLLSTDGGTGIALVAVYGLVPSLATGLASVIAAAVALERYDPKLERSESVRDRLVGRGATLGAGGVWLALTIILGLASPDSWVVAAAMIVVGVAVALSAGSIAVTLTRAADRRSGFVVDGVVARR